VHVATPAPAPANFATVNPSARACTPSLVSVYPIQMNALISMGFSDPAVNESVLTRFAGNLQAAANSLLEQIRQ